MSCHSTAVARNGRRPARGPPQSANATSAYTSASYVPLGVTLHVSVHLSVSVHVSVTVPFPLRAVVGRRVRGRDGVGRRSAWPREGSEPGRARYSEAPPKKPN